MKKGALVLVVLFALAASAFAGQEEKKELPKTAKYPDGTMVEIPWDLVNSPFILEEPIVINSAGMRIAEENESVPSEQVHGATRLRLTEDKHVFFQDFIDDRLVLFGITKNNISDTGELSYIVFLIQEDGTILAGDDFKIELSPTFFNHAGEKSFKETIAYVLLYKKQVVATRQIEVEIKNGNQ